MLINDRILFKYFLSDEHFQQIIEAAEMEREALFYYSYPHPVPGETRIEIAGESVEMAVVKLIEIEERVKRIKSELDKSQENFKNALHKLRKREQILLFTYYRTGIILTNSNELEKAKEYLIDALEALKEKENRLIKKEYMQQFKEEYGGKQIV